MGEARRFKQAKFFQGWLELIRLPNLFTIPGDVLAGASLALISRNERSLILPVLIISLSLYISGLILNDYVDREVDGIERPERPIPSGKVSPEAALLSALFLIFLALVLSYFVRPVFWTTIGLVILITFYNTLARKISLLGIIIMGLCRGTNILLGASIGINTFGHMVLAGAAVETLYITATSNIACDETKGSPTNSKLWLPFVSIIISFPIMLWITGASILGIFLVLVCLGWIFCILINQSNKKNIPKMIGELIRSLILIQCVFIAVSMNKNSKFWSYHIVSIIFLFLSFLASGFTARKFHGS